MLAKDVMKPGVKVIHFDSSVQEAAKLMEQTGCGSLPVEKNDKMIGMITDRDIALRVAAAGKDAAKTKVSEVMSEGIAYCFEDDEVDSLIDKMAKQHHGRIPVINEQKRLVGIISLAGIGRRGNDPKLSHRIMTGLSSS